MSTINYTQFGLSPRFDLGLDEVNACSVVYEVSLSVVDGQIVLTHVDAKTGQDYIAVTENCYITVTLLGDQLYLSKAYDAITTKEELSSYYGGLVYEDYNEKLDRYKTVRFQALFNDGGKYGTVHPFNINVDLLQKAADGTVSWTGLSIDPDIQNPPPR
ncbi:nucleotide synthetase [Novosphingobium decolorationis]|uniref:Uncharacterized protein n=1 Tax=Novosphingobium decolorationis TaxID=2698673 RepID=A0ABX8E455_9SPHN|nr:nucleotide synthetase [Novosphingobium decolorationis]QVM83724.1 hypothetical protein HT578_08455 [Novosphingobium decolorationis]